MNPATIRLPEGRDEIGKLPRVACEQGAGQVCDDEIRRSHRRLRHVPDVSLHDVPDPVALDVLAGVLDCVRVRIDRRHERGAQPGRDDREDTRSGADVDDDAVLQLAVLQQHEAQARRLMVPGAESARRLDFDHDRGGRHAREPRILDGRKVPWRRHDDAADSNRGEIGLCPARPVLVCDVHGLDGEPGEVGRRSGGREGRRRDLTRARAAEMRRPRSGRGDVVFVNGDELVIGEQRGEAISGGEGGDGRESDRERGGAVVAHPNMSFIRSKKGLSESPSTSTFSTGMVRASSSMMRRCSFESFFGMAARAIT